MRSRLAHFGRIGRAMDPTAKWLELLKQMVPSVTRAAILRDPSQGSGTSQFAAIATVAPTLSVNVNPINMGDADQITQSRRFSRALRTGLVVTAGGAAQRHREMIVELAARHKLPAVYSERSFVTVGGLVSYGPDFVDQFRRAAGYVDRILKGEKAFGVAGARGVQVRAGHQSQDRQGARPDGAVEPACPRRRGDRMKIFLLRCMCR